MSESAADAAFVRLDAAGQVRALRRLGRGALRAYGLEGASTRLLNHGENTTFRVDDGHSRWMLRVHREGYQTEASIRSELAWLAALARDIDAFQVPCPVVDRRGEVVQTVQDPATGLTRRCVLFRWVPGRFLVKRRGARCWRAVGFTTGLLHAHAAQWRRPGSFVRHRWDLEGMIGTQSPTWGDPEVIPALDEPTRALFRQARTLIRRRLEGVACDHLIHADLHAGNVLFEGDRAHAIDFDDCGFGYALQDMVTSLGHTRWRPHFERTRDAYLAGYERAAPRQGLDLSLFEAVQAARVFCWVSWIWDRSRANPRLLPHVEPGIARAQENLRRYLAWEGVTGP